MPVVRLYLATPDLGIVDDPVEVFGCDSSYPDDSVPPAPPGLDCGDIPHRQFTALSLDLHNLDGASTESGVNVAVLG